MARTKTPSYNTNHCAGDYGDANSARMYADLAAAATNDVFVLARVQQGARIDDMKVVHAALGATTGFSIGYEYEDGSETDNDYFLVVADSSTAGCNRSNAAPKEFTGPANIILTKTGAGASTGRVDVIPTMVYRGPL